MRGAPPRALEDPMTSKKDAGSKKASGGEISATVEESNKMRASLGLKPLQTDEPENKKLKGTSNDPVHAPAGISGKNVPAEQAANEKPSADEVQKRVSAARNKRHHEELTSGKGLGDILADEGASSASDWVSKTRGQKAPVVPKELQSGQQKKEYTSADVAGMKVRHDPSKIQEGQEVTVTLADQPLLDDKGNLRDAPDELVNASIRDVETSERNEDLKKQKDYDPDKATDILEKYNDLPTGPRGFSLGSMIEEQDPEKRLAILTKLGEQSLDPKLTIQKDFYTEEEMKQFRKPKKKVKKRPRQSIDPKDKDEITTSSGAPRAPDERAADSDEEDPELYEQLSKQRRLVRRSDQGAVQKGEAALASISKRAMQVDEKQKQEEEEAADKEKALKEAGKPEKSAMTATTEFCNVVQTPLEKIDTLKHESYRGSTLYKEQVVQRKGVKDKGVIFGRKPNPKEVVEDEVLEGLDEEQLDLSASSGIAYLRARAQMGRDQDSHMNRKTDNRPLEMSTVDGDIKLEYRDDFGRVQTPKEAFRAISWKFHGKMPGRKNLERRLGRLENEMKLKSMNVLESLPTLRALTHVQKADAKPYMLLSGQNEK